MRTKSFVVMSAAVTILALPSAELMAERGDRKANPSGAARRVRASVVPASAPVPNVVGTLTYDNNVPFSRHGSDNGTVGNLFNAGFLDPHSIANVSFRLAGNYGSPSLGGSMYMTIWDQNPGSFMLLHRVNVAGLPFLTTMGGGGGGTITMFTAMAPLAPPIVGHNGAFVGGLHQTFFNACAGNVALNTTCDGVALTMGGVDPGMGFHAIRVPFATEMFTPVITTVPGAGTVIPTTNAIFRATGDNLPVELMNFDVR